MSDVSREVSSWRARSTTIADPAARARVLRDLRVKRSYLNGSAFFATLAPRRSAGLVRLLVALQVLANYVDTVSERDAAAREGPPRRWTTMLVDAVDLQQAPDPRVYRQLPEGPYLAELVTACRQECARLPSYESMRVQIAREARRVATLDLEHDPCSERRADALQHFATREFGERSDLSWWELAAGASSMLTVTVALALAAREVRPRPTEVAAAIGAYRVVATLSALLDNYIDQIDDRGRASNNYILTYGTAARLGDLIEQALRGAATLPNPKRHVLLVAMMVAMFLSADEARRGELRADTRALLARAGTTTRILLPVLRAWRLAHGQLAG